MVKKIRRKLTSKIDMPEIDELSTSTYMIDKLMTVYDEQKSSVHLKHEKLFDVARAHLPMDASSPYLIVDKLGIINNLGSHTLSIREMPFSQRKKVLQSALNYGWIKPNIDTSTIRIHQVEPSIDINNFFRKNGDDWKYLVDMWCTENLKKDERLVDSFKATQIPLIGDPAYWQPYNSHAVWLTNSGTGKSFFSEIAGVSPVVDMSIAGFFGANVDNYQKQQVGALHGHGYFCVDEIEQLTRYDYSSHVMLDLLTYLETGKVERRLKIPIRCQGTKSIIFTSNPQSDDMLASLVKMFSILQPDADTTRLGRRMAFFLLGNDFKRVDITDAKPTLRELLPRIIHYCMVSWWEKRVSKVLKSNIKWANDENACRDIINTIENKSLSCPNEKARNFIKGLSLNMKRVRMSACRIAVLENLEKLYGSGYRSCLQSVDEAKESLFLKLVSANIKSIDQLILTAEELQPSEENAKMLKEKFPSMSTRDIGLMLDVSHMTIQRWLNE